MITSDVTSQKRSAYLSLAQIAVEMLVKCSTYIRHRPHCLTVREQGSSYKLYAALQ